MSRRLLPGHLVGPRTRLHRHIAPLGNINLTREFPYLLDGTGRAGLAHPPAVRALREQDPEFAAKAADVFGLPTLIPGTKTAKHK